jgi:hypothetical protein
VLRAVGQPQLRGAHPSGGEGQLPRFAAARRRIRTRRSDGHRPGERAAGRGRERRGRVPARSLAERGGDPGDDLACRARRDVLAHVCGRVHRRSRLARAAGPGG